MIVHGLFFWFVPGLFSWFVPGLFRVVFMFRDMFILITLKKSNDFIHF